MFSCSTQGRHLERVFMLSPKALHSWVEGGVSGAFSHLAQGRCLRRIFVLSPREASRVLFHAWSEGGELVLMDNQLSLRSTFDWWENCKCYISITSSGNFLKSR